MADERIEKWQRAKIEREKAEEWNNLPKGKKYGNSDFNISLAHCKPPILCRAGQQYPAGQNYWETSDYFNKAILKYIVSNWNEIYPVVLNILKGEEIKALTDCQSYIDELQKLINKNKEC